MITTVTTTTTAVLTTAAAASLALIAVLTLLALLIQKEIIIGLSSARAQRLGRALNIAIVPLALVFFVTIAFKVAEVWR